MRVLTRDDRVEVLPTLPSLSISETRDFYRDHLGFDEIVHEDADYLIIRREFVGERMELHYVKCRRSISVAAASMRCMPNSPSGRCRNYRK
jgi:hypothetical protein